MLFCRFVIVAAVAFAPVPALAQELADLGRWSEVALPGAPFRIDIPMPFKPVDEKMNGTTKVSTWQTNYGLMSIEITFSDRVGSTSFTPREFLEMLGGGLVDDWVNPSANLTDLQIVGHQAALIELEHDVDSGRLRTERLLIRVGDDDWTVQTTRFVGEDDALDSAHIFRSIQAPAPAPVLTQAAIGRMTIKGFGEPIVTVDPLEGDASATYEKWVTYYFEYQGAKAWIYNIRVKPGNVFDAPSVAQTLLDATIEQSDPKPSIFPFPMTVGTVQGTFARGQTRTTAGEECFRIFSAADGQEGWAMLLAGPNAARNEAMFREMIDSIQIAPE